MELNQEIEELNSILSKYGERNWRISKVSNKSGASDVVRMFGGMGSINDLYICKINGHNISENIESEINERVQHLLSSIYEKCVSYEKPITHS